MTHRPTALITGSAKRIGREFAIYLASIGYDLVLHYKSSKKDMLETIKLAQKHGAKCIAVKSDLANYRQVNNFFKGVIKKVNSLDLVINNASQFAPCSFSEISEDILNEYMNVHIKLPLYLAQFYQKFLNGNTGQIINILDTTIKNDSKAYKKYFAYLLTKKSLSNLNKMLALELAPNIKVNAIAPGTVLPIDNCEDSIKYFNEKSKQVPLQENPSVESMLETLDYLINSKHLTGQVIYVDSGQNLL